MVSQFVDICALKEAKSSFSLLAEGHGQWVIMLWTATRVLSLLADDHGQRVITL